MASPTPASASLSSTWSSSGLPATGTSGFGIRSVSGRMRTPRPAARTMARVGLTGILRNFSVPVGSGMDADDHAIRAERRTVAHAILARHDAGTTQWIFDDVKLGTRCVKANFRLPPTNHAVRPFSIDPAQ